MNEEIIKENKLLKQRIHELEISEAQRKLVEEALRISEIRYRTIFETTGTTMLIVEEDMTISLINDRFESLTGYVREEVEGKRKWTEFVEKSDLKAMMDHHKMRRIDSNLTVRSYEFRLVHKGGTLKDILLTVDLIPGTKRSVASLVDITELKRAKVALQESEYRVQELIELAVDGILSGSPEGVVTSANASTLAIFGMEKSGVLGKHVRDLFPPRVLDEKPLRFDLLMQGKTVVSEREILRPDGKRVFVEMHSRKMPDGTYHSIIRDITERRHTEEALRESEEKFRVLAEATPTAVMLYQDDRWIYANRSAQAISGYSEKELLAMNFWDFAHPDYQAIIRSEGRKRQSGEKTTNRHEFRIVMKDGTEKWMDLSGASTTFRGRLAGIISVLDITERKMAEEERRSLEERLNRAEKMEALGQMAGGVAHDLNNVLGVLTGYSELLLAEIPEGQRARAYAEKILQSTERGAAIIQDLLTLARRGVTTAEVINLNSIVSNFLTTPVLERIKSYHPRVVFRTVCDKNLLNIKGSPIHLEKTLMNLVANAAEAISGVGEVTIQTRSLYLDKAISGYDKIKEGNYAVLIVSDTGTGIPIENREKIFEPFYTKKTMGRSGTGLGLAIVWGTVRDHNGYIDVQTNVGAGTTFSLYFPATLEELIAPHAKEPIEHYMGNGQSVLVVDDIAEQRDIASGLLGRLGYKVHSVSGGEAAVEYLKSNKADILVLDMIMSPGIDGLETYQRILEVNPMQKAILVSGFSETDRVREAQKLGAGTYVKKPYLMEKIGMAIRDELNR